MSYRIPLVQPCLPTLQEIEPDLRQMLDSGRLTNFGPFSVRLEAQARRDLGVAHAAAVSSATSGLCLLLSTLSRGSEVIVPSFTFVATVQAIVWNGLVPVFADIDQGTLNVCPRSVEARLSSRTAAILAVHAFGAPCNIEALREISRDRHVPLFFDSAHAFGSRHSGTMVGSFGDAEVFSLSATKVVPSGEGGLVTTNNKRLHNAILDRRNYGLKANGSRDCANPGLNAKLPEFSAIMASREIISLDWRVRRRNEIARRYLAGLKELPGLRFQEIQCGDISTYKDFTIQVEPNRFGTDRNQLRASLAHVGIETAPYFWPAIHRMTLFSKYASDSQPLPETDRACDQILSLPIFETMSDESVDFVIRSIASVSRTGRGAGTRIGISCPAHGLVA